MFEKKQNVFDDFIAAAEYLVKERYASPQTLGIMGGSNGGLLVGAVMQQRPDLFAVALPAVGVMDMLRYHRFTGGAAWATEYGSAENAKDFAYLHNYSPLHNVKPGTCYPATLVTTADHDDRVVPSHSFKFAAAMQAAQGCDKPVLIRDRDAGVARLPADRQADRRAGRHLGVCAGEHEAAKPVDRWTLRQVGRVGRVGQVGWVGRLRWVGYRVGRVGRLGRVGWLG